MSSSSAPFESAFFKKRKRKTFIWFPRVFVTAGGVFHCSEWTEQPWHAGLLLHNMWNLSSPTRDWTCVPSISRQISNPWATGEVPWKCFWLWFHPDDFLSFFLNWGIAAFQCCITFCCVTRGISSMCHTLFIYLFMWPFCPACETLVIQPGVNPCPLQWKPGVLTNGPPGKSHMGHTFFNSPYPGEKIIHCFSEIKFGLCPIFYLASLMSVQTPWTSWGFSLIFLNIGMFKCIGMYRYV